MADRSQIAVNTDKLYDTDLTDAAWVLIAPVLPATRPGGGLHTTSIRAVLNAILYLYIQLPRMKKRGADFQKARDALLAESDERQRAEEALRASEQRLQDILDNTTAVVFVKDLELRYILVNREYERRHQVQRDQIRGKTDFDIHPHDVAETLRANDRHVIEAGAPIQFEETVPMAEGERQYVVVKFLLRDGTAKPYAVCGIATDITELKRAEELQARRAAQAALRADIHAAFSVGPENALQTILQRSAEAVVRHLDGAFARIWTLNDRENMLELQASAGLYTRLDGEHRRVPVGNLKIGLIAQERKPHLTNELQNDKRVSHPEWAMQEGLVAFAGYPLELEGRLIGVLAMFARKFLGQDTLEALEVVADTIAQGIERKRAEEKLARLNRTLQTLYQCNQALVRATEEYELLHSVCRILVEIGGLRMAWVGYRELNAEKTVRPVAQAGYDDGYLEQINITWADTETGRGPTGTAIRTGKAYWTRDNLTDPNMAQWRAHALRRGYASSTSLPLLSHGEAFGALTLHAEEPDAFNESTIEQYTDLANNLAYGVTAIRTREESKRAEEALRESEQRLQDIVDNTTAVVFVKDLELRYILVNREYERRHHVQRDQIRGKTDFDIHPHDIAEAVRANDRRVIEAGEPIEFEETVPSADGDRCLIVAKFLLRDRTGKPYAVCGVATDITDRKRAENEIRQLNVSLEKRVTERTFELARSEEKFRALFEGTSQAVVLHDENGILEVNPSWLRFLGYSSLDEVVGKHPAELSAPIQPGGECAEVLARMHIANTLANGSERFDWMMSRRDGTELSMEVFLTRIQLGGRQLIQAVCNDITQRKQAEAELVRTLAREKELGQLRSKFVSMVSHEFRTPLGIIQSSAEILKDYLEQLEPSEREDHLQSICHNTRRMAGIMEEVLLIGSFDAGKMEFKPGALELRTLVRGLVDEVLSATGRRCPIELSLSQMPAEIQADGR